MLRMLLLLLFVGVSTISYSQFSVKGPHERERLFHRWKVGQKPRPQMSHFSKRGNDMLMRSNGTSYRRNRKQKYNVDGNGFDTPNQGKLRKIR